jgi:hypothetical protein
MQKTLIGIFLFSFLLAGSLSAHHLHISYTSIEIDAEKDSLSVSCKFFTSDFNLLFYHLFERNIAPQMDKAFGTSELELINNYLKYRFTLLADKDTIALQYIRKDQDEESLWLFYKGRIPDSTMKSFTIHNLLLLDLYEDQTNLVIITNGKKETGFAFNFTNRQSVLEMVEY